MDSELKPPAEASVTPIWAISCVRAEQQPVLPEPRMKAAAEMESELKLLAAASVMPGTAISCLRRAGCPFRKGKQRPRCKASRSRWWRRASRQSGRSVASAPSSSLC